MSRIAIVATLAVLAAIPAARAAQQYHEAPELAARVQAGELPPIQERLPKNPFVVEPVDGIGTYGGTWRRVHTGPQDSYGATYVVKETLLIFSRDYQRILPCLAESYEASDDYRTFTFHLRKGIRWSDGAPLTADDYLYHYEHVSKNRELTPVPSMALSRGGEYMEMRKLDTYSFQISFKLPHTIFLHYMSGLYAPTLRAPAHFCKQFHPDFVAKEELDRMIAEGKYAHWTDLYKKKTYYIKNPEAPTLHAWNAIDDNTGNQRWVRNPYYWKVDPAGNQLPYIGRQLYVCISDPEALLLKARAGEIDLQARRIGGINVSGIENYPFLAEGSKENGYRLVVRSMFRQIKYGIYLNYSLGLDIDTTNKETAAASKNANIEIKKMPLEEVDKLEPERRMNERKRRLFNDLRFRRALSHALNRDEINAFCLQGLGTPAQFSAHPDSRWFRREHQRKYIEFDQELSRKLLDEVGLTQWDGKHEYRILPNGDPLTFYIRIQGPNVEAMELVREMWADVGIHATVSPVQTNYWYQMNRNGNYDISCAAPVGGWDGCYRHAIVAPPYGGNYAIPKWFQWCNTNGQAGDEPAPWAKKMADMAQQIMLTPPGAEQDALIVQLTGMWSDNIMAIGTVMSPPEATFAVVNNRMRNVPDPLPFLQAAHPACFYYVDGSNGAETPNR